jgi:4-amino-4-deoxy-L-arabinose transferase-like glycosyltransferase
VSFWLLQGLWRRLLDPEETFWANFLFLFAPLSLYFGQAFLPEMLIQCASFAILVLLWKYVETPSAGHFLALALAGLIGMLLKAPEILHLGLVIAVMIFAREGVAAWRKVRYWAALAAAAGILRFWSRHLDSVNAAGFPEWTSAKVVELMIGPWFEHVRPLGYFRVLVYLTLFAGAVGGMVWVVWGLKEALCRRRTVFVLAWLGSLVFFYVFWAGASSRIHSYYNLPALGPVCLLFALGCARCLGTERARRHPAAARAAIAVVVLAGAAGPCAFLYQQDRVLMSACDWLRQNTAPADLALVRVNHRTDTSTYRHNSTVAYYAQRRIWCWVPDLPEDQRQRALLTSRWALVTHPQKETGAAERLRRWVKRITIPVEDMSWLEQKDFAKHFEGDGFTVYKRRP